MNDALTSSDEVQIALNHNETGTTVVCELCKFKVYSETLALHWLEYCEYFKRCD